MMKHKTINGRIEYTSRKPEMMGQKRGFETFSFTRHTDNSVIMRAHCEIEEPAPTVMRDIVLHYDNKGRPKNLHVHLTLGDDYLGSGWFLVTHNDDVGGKIECESHGSSIGRVSQKQDFDFALDGFGSHPIVGDGYLTKCMDISQGPYKKYINCFLPSADHRGATPPLISQIRIGLEYLGEETIEVRAGSFNCRRFRFVDDQGEGMGGKAHPVYEFWVTADENSIFVQGGVGGYMQTWYELIELEIA